jgi:tetratricopeptide (TPR) repeat protein
MKKYYEILGLEIGASEKEINDAYVKLSKDLDPKENDNLDFFIEEYNLVQEAYKNLIKSDKRQSEDHSKYLPKTKPENEKIPKIKSESKNTTNSTKKNVDKTQENNSITVEINDSEETLVNKYEKSDKINKLSVLVMYKLLASEGNKACAMALHKINGVSLKVSDHLINIIVQGISSNTQACNEDVISQGIGEFGLSVSNPVPVYGIPSNTTYLSKLRTNGGEKITWNRTGSTTTSNIEKDIDVYEIFDSNKKKISTIYINPYHWVISKKIPKGFISKNDSSSKNKSKVKTNNKTNSDLKNKTKKNNFSNTHKKKRIFKIILISVISILLLLFISMYLYSFTKLNEAKTYYEKASIRYELEDYNRAQQDILGIINIYNDLENYPFLFFEKKVFEDTYILEGNIKYYKNKLDQSRNSYLKAILINKNNQEAYFKIGDLFEKESKQNNINYDKAIEYYLKGVRLYDDYDFESKVKFHYDEKDYLLAIAYCEDEIENNPRSFSGYFNKARSLYLLDGRENDAISAGLSAIKINPSNKGALYNVGLYYRYLNKDLEAINFFSKAIEIDLEYEIAYFQRGKAFYSSSQYSKATEDFSKTITLNSNNAEAYSYRGSSKYYLNKYKEALNDFSKAKSIDSEVYINNYAYENSLKEYNKIKKRQSVITANNKRKNKIKNLNLSIGDYFKGGIVFLIDENKSEVKVMATSHSSKKLPFYSSYLKCSNLSLNGFSDWYLPTKKDFIEIKKHNMVINRKGPNAPKYFTRISSSEYWIDSNATKFYMFGTSVNTSTYRDYSNSSYMFIPIRKIKL